MDNLFGLDKLNNLIRIINNRLSMFFYFLRANKYKVVCSLFIILLNMSFFGTNLRAQNGGTIFFSGHMKVRMEKLGGMDMTIVNIETGKLYYPRYSCFQSRYGVIENLPQGRYKVYTITIGDMPFNCYDDNKYISDYFGILNIEEGKIYYLGHIKVIKHFEERLLVCTIDDNFIPKGLIKKMKRRKLISSVDEIIKTYPYKEKKLIIKY